MTWEENGRAIRQLWPDAVWNDALRSLFMKELEPLDQTALADAIRQVKKTYTSQQPEVKWVLEAYAQVQNTNRLAAKKPVPPPERHIIPDVDEDEEHKLLRDWASVIDEASTEELDSFEPQIMASMDSAKISARTAFLLLGRIRGRMANAG